MTEVYNAIKLSIWYGPAGLTRRAYPILGSSCQNPGSNHGILALEPWNHDLDLDLDLDLALRPRSQTLRS